MDQSSTTNCVVWMKTNSVSNYTLSVQKYVIHKTNIRARVKDIIPSLFQSCLRKMNRQIGNFSNMEDEEK